MASISEKLLKLKEEIEQAKLDKAQVEGALKQNMQRLKDEFQVRSVEAANKKLDELNKQKLELEDSIESAMKSLEEKYQW